MKTGKLTSLTFRPLFSFWPVSRCSPEFLRLLITLKSELPGRLNSGEPSYAD